MLVDAGPMYQAGTLSGNPLAMTAGIKTLEILDRPGTYEHLDRVTGKLIQGILDAGREAGHEMCGGHISGESLFPELPHVPLQACQNISCIFFGHQVHSSNNAMAALGAPPSVHPGCLDHISPSPLGSTSECDEGLAMLHLVSSKDVQAAQALPLSR